MSEWKKVKVSFFLKERSGRYKPDDQKVVNLKRLNKIDFTGNIHLADKKSKTDMIIIKPGDLVISGINVAKGAIAIYEGKEDLTATIHYSSYIFDKSKINIDYFKKFVKSPLFVQLLKDQVKGGIKTEIKAKHLLQLSITLPDIKTQNEIDHKFQNIDAELLELEDSIEYQDKLLKKLRQTVLQEAIEGKLTADWRKANQELVTGENSAEKLLEQIKAEKQKLIDEGKIKKQKPLPPITDEEKPFELPEGWVWCRLGEIADGFQYGSSLKSLKKGKVPVLRMGNIQNGNIQWDKLKYTNNKNEIEQYQLQYGDLLFNRTNSRELVGKTALFISEKPAIFAGYLVRFRINITLNYFYTNIVMNSKLHRDWCNEFKTDSINQSNINATKLKLFRFPLPPIYEQNQINNIINRLSYSIHKIEQQIKDRKDYIDKLMATILKEAFEVPVQKAIKQSITPFQQMQIIGAVILHLKQNNMRQGEMVLAKYLYLLSFIYGIKTGFSFKKWHFGPYDPAIKKLTANKKYFKKQGISDFETIGLINEAELFKYSNKIIAGNERNIDELINLFKGYSASKRNNKIELMASVLKVIEDDNVKTVDNIFQGLQEWKTDKAKSGYSNKAEKFSKDEVAKCLEFVKKKGWV